MSQVIFAMPDIFDDNIEMQDKVSISSELFNEIENQIKRRLMNKYGSNINLADGVSLYANSLDTGKHIYDVNHTKNGRQNKNKNIHGFNFEAIETGALNREAIINNSGKKSSTTDQLAGEKKNGTLKNKKIDRYAKKNHKHTDIVTIKNGNVIDSQQLKHVKNIHLLYKEAYTTHKDAPKKIVIPSDQINDKKEGTAAWQLKQRSKFLEKKAARTSDCDKKKRIHDEIKRIKIAQKKLTPGKTASTDSFSPYTAVVKQTVHDTALRTGENIAKSALSEIALFAAGGTMWEIRDSFTNPQEFTIWDRVKRLFLSIIEKLSDLAIIRLTREATHEIFNILLGILKSTFKSIGHLLSALGKAVDQVWESICDYISGKIKSYTELVAIITKAFFAVGIAVLAAMLEKQLSSYGIPTDISGIISAALAGFLIVFTSKGIDTLVFTLTSAFSKAEAAKHRREQIAEYCAEILPKIIDEREHFNKVVRAYYKERSAILGSAYIQMQNALAVNSTQKLLASLESINNVYGKTLGWSSQEEFDEMMYDENHVFVL
jgi:hypothetical protein